MVDFSTWIYVQVSCKQLPSDRQPPPCRLLAPQLLTVGSEGLNSGLAALGWGPSANGAGTTFIPGCGGSYKASMGAEHLVIVLWSRHNLSPQLSWRVRKEAMAQVPRQFEAKVTDTHKLGVASGGPGTTSVKVLKGRGLSCTPLLGCTSSGLSKAGRGSPLS